MSYYGRKLLLGILGIYVSHMTMSYFIEKLFNLKYISNVPAKDGTITEHYFVYPSLVTWAGCLFCTIYGLIYAQFSQERPNNISTIEKARLGLLFTLNYLPTNYALLYVSYPLQVVAKNTRYLLVVIVGVFFSRVKKSRQLKLPRSKIFIAILITLGAGLFMYYESMKKSKSNHLDPSKRWIGYLLLLLAIICDALFSDSQAYCKAVFKPTSNQLFLASNLYGFLLIFIFSLVTGSLYPSLRFCIHHPVVLYDIITLGVLQVLGQVAVYYVVSNFKQHIYPLISTTRKIFTVLLSIFIFNHGLNKAQWGALLILLIAMGYELFDQIKTQDLHRQARKQKLQQKFSQRQKENDDSQSNSLIKLDEDAYDKSLIKRTSSDQRENNIMRQQQTLQKPRDQSLSKFRYDWRVNQVIQDRQTSVTPVKKAFIPTVEG